MDILLLACVHDHDHMGVWGVEVLLSMALGLGGDTATVGASNS